MKPRPLTALTALLACLDRAKDAQDEACEALRTAFAGGAR